MPQAPPDEYLTLSEAARLLGVSPSRVRQLARDGRLPVWKQAGWWVRYLRSDVERLNEQRQTIERMSTDDQ